LKLGKWAESKIVFKDTSTGKRGITRSPTTLANYLKVYMGQVTAPAGTVQVRKATHGLDTVIGGVANIVNKSNTSSIFASIIAASVIEFTLPGYNAAPLNFDVIIWGTSSA